MIDELRSMAIFAKTVEAGSFRAAARALGLSPSVVSHHVAQLEARLGVALLYRSTRRLSLTHDGERLFESAKAMLAAAEQGLNAMAQSSAEPAGRLSITVPAMLARGALVGDIAAFARKYPKVALTISFSDTQQDLVRDGIDLAIRIGSLSDSGLKARKLFDLDRRLVVAPGYAAQQPAVTEPAELAGWDWIGLLMRPDYKVLVNGRGDSCRIDYQPRIRVDSLEAVCQLAVAGLGLASPPTFLIEPELRSGRLVEALPGWSVESLGVYAVWPPNAARESLTHRLIRFLLARQPRATD